MIIQTLPEVLHDLQDLRGKDRGREISLSVHVVSGDTGRSQKVTINGNAESLSHFLSEIQCNSDRLTSQMSFEF